MILTFRGAATLSLLFVGGSMTLGGCGQQAGDPAGSTSIETRASALGGTGPTLLATATLDRPTDFAGFSYLMENGMPQNVLGGVGSGLTWAGGTTFLAVPDRGPNATPIPNGALNDNTTSFISRFETIDLGLTQVPSGALPFTLAPSLVATTLLSSGTPLIYGNTVGLPNAVPPGNTATTFYFSGRSDNFGPGLSTNPDFARFDPECIRVSRDGNTVFVSDEYGPYVYQFDRLTGQRVRTYQLPDRFAISNLSPVGALEISGNTQGRVTNKGVEGLAITPDGNTLVALVQSPLIQDGGDGGRANRIVTIDVATGATHEYVYDNQIGTKAFNSSEIIAFNDHQFLIDTRDGKGLGDGTVAGNGSVAVVKQLWAVDISSAQDVSALSGAATLLARAVPKVRFLDLVTLLNANGIVSTKIPSKIEGLAFGQDVVIGGVVTHTLYVGNDNDFLPDPLTGAGPNLWYVIGFTDADLAALNFNLSFVQQQVTGRGPDLALTKTVAAPTALTGSDVSYTLTVANTGLLPADAVLVTDTLPAELQLTSCTSAGTCGSSTSGPTVSFASLAGAASGSAVISAKLSCAVADGTVIVNQAAASFAAVDPTPADNASAATITAVNPAPVVGNVSVDTPVLWPANHTMRTVQVGYDATDNCAGTVCSLAVTSNEGSASDWQIVDTHTVSLRAERNGNGPGRTYTIAISCKDSGGAVSLKSATVLVPHDQR